MVLNNKNNESSRNQRLIEIIDYLKDNDKIYNDKDFAKKIGIGRTFLSDMKNLRKEVSEQTVLKILNKFDEISRKWLLSGDGEMLNTDKNNVFVNGKKNTAINNSSVNSRDKNYDKVIDILKDELQIKNEQIRIRDEQIGKLIEKISKY